MPRSIKPTNRKKLLEFALDTFDTNYTRGEKLFAFEAVSVRVITSKLFPEASNRNEKELTPYLIPMSSGDKFFTLDELREWQSQIETLPLDDQNKDGLTPLIRESGLFDPAGGYKHLLAKLKGATGPFKDLDKRVWESLKHKFLLKMLPNGDGFFIQVRDDSELCSIM